MAFNRFLIGGGSSGGGTYSHEGVTPKSTLQNFALNVGGILLELAIFLLSLWLMVALAGEMTGAAILTAASVYIFALALGSVYLIGTIQTTFKNLVKEGWKRMGLLLVAGFALALADHLGVWSDLFLLRWWLTPQGLYYSWNGDAFQPAGQIIIFIRLFGLCFIPLYTIVPTGAIVRTVRDTLLARLLLSHGREIETPSLRESVRTVPVDPAGIELADGTRLQAAPRGQKQQQEETPPPDWSGLGSQTEHVQ